MGACGSKPVNVASSAPIVDKDFLSNYDEVKGPYTTTDGNGRAELVFAQKGLASRSGAPPSTVPGVFKKAMKRMGSKPAMRAERPVPALGADGKWPAALPLEEWTTWTWSNYYDDSAKVARALMSIGVQPHDGVNIFGFNAPEWFIGEMGAIMAGAHAAGIYPSDTPEQIVYKSRHSNGAAALVEGEKQMNAFVENIEKLPCLKAVVAWAHEPSVAEVTRKDGSVVKLFSWANFMKLSNGVEEAALEARLEAQQPGDCCALIYTSGTTGSPKAVMISHDNILFECQGCLALLPFFGNDGGEERLISYLPLSHVAGMMLDIVCPIACTAFRSGWACAYFARPYDLKVSAIGDRLRAVRPTVFLGVPRVWEKIAETMKALGAQTKGVKKKVARWAKGKGLAHALNCQMGGNGKKPFMYGKADKIVLSQIKLKLGLDKCKFGFTGAAPIMPDTLKYFGSLGIQINEVYGMSECTGACTWSSDEAHVWGSCGWAMPGVEIKVFKVDEETGEKKECPKAKDLHNATEEEQGELCYRGRNIMMGYMANPSLGEEHVAQIKKKTADAVDAEGWLHSGDKGCVDERGCFKITGRYKELIIGAGGENIAPVPIENSVKNHCAGLANVMMVGDKRKFNVALVTLLAEGASGEKPGNDNLAGAAKKVDPSVATITAARQSPIWQDYIKNGIVAANKLAPNNASKIQRFTILPHDFSTETTELTSTLKLKRSVVYNKYNEAIEAIYAADKKATYVPFVGAEAAGPVSVHASTSIDVVVQGAT